MTSWIVGHTKRFKAPMSERAVNSLVSHVRLQRRRLGVQAAYGGDMSTTMDKYLAISPGTYAKEIETPLLVLHSENDLRCNIEQGEVLFTCCG